MAEPHRQDTSMPQSSEDLCSISAHDQNKTFPLRASEQDPKADGDSTFWTGLRTRLRDEGTTTTAKRTRVELGLSGADTSIQPESYGSSHKSQWLSEGYMGLEGPDTSMPPSLSLLSFMGRHKTKTFPLRASQQVLKYKESIQHKHERSFLSVEPLSLAALYTEPLILQQHQQGSFQSINVEQLFNKPNIRFYYPEMIILQGSSGSGKSFTCQKLMLDWASGMDYLQHFDVVFYLMCEELKCISEEMNLIDLLSWSSSLSSAEIEMMLNSECRVLYIIDGLDELTFMHSEGWTMSRYHRAPPEVIVSSMLRSTFLPRSSLLITTRTEVLQSMFLKTSQSMPFKRSQHPSKIMGFSEKAVEEYFQKFFQDEELFRKAFKCVEANETLFAACSIPVICWIICTVIRERFKEGSGLTSGLETTTSIYIDFVSTLLNHCQGLSQSVPTLLRSLGQLAEKGMLEQQVLFDEKSVNESVSDPGENPFLWRRTIHQEAMFSFVHRSFQEFFSSLYYVLLDEEESQRKVKELLHSVERGWALSCWSDRDFSMTDAKVRCSVLLQPVILFLCGLCKEDPILSFFEKHNMAVSVNIETQFKEWIHQYSQRYQNEQLLFILHCLYELHQKSFTGQVLEHLPSLDLSNTPLKSSDCWMLEFCLQSCVKMSNLRLSITSEHLQILQSALYRCEELWLKVDDISDDLGDLISALGEGKLLKELIINKEESKASHNKGFESICQEIIASVKDEEFTLSVRCLKTIHFLLISELTLTCSCSEISVVNWRIFLQNLKYQIPRYHSSLENEFLPLDALQSVPGLKKIHLQTKKLTDRWIPKILSLVEAFPSLNELRISTAGSFIPLNITQSLRKCLTTGWNLTVLRKSVLIERDGTCFTEEELKRMNTEKIKGAETLSGQPSSGDAEMFTPEHIQKDDKHKHNTYRFVCPHAGQFECSLTSLVFVMEGEGELLYRVVSWDPRLLDGLGQMQPAGPLYDIKCSAGSVSQLHFPHCEIFSEENKDSLAVAHLIGDNIAIMKPLKVTETHVIINIKDLSIFGLIRRMLFPPSPVVTQVLVFLRPITVRQKENILDVLLLPWNVPLSDVKEQHAENTHLKTSSKCSLTPGSEYRLCCQPEGSTVQPESETFDCNFGPNYHPTFEVFVDVNTAEVRLGLLDKTEETEVWVPRRIPLTGQDVEHPVHRRLSESEFVKKHRDKLIERVSSVLAISDSLLTKDMITCEKYNEIRAAEPKEEKTRLLLDALESGGAPVKAEFYKLLKEREPYLVEDLE